jgi:hypothetical protein
MVASFAALEMRSSGTVAKLKPSCVGDGKERKRSWSLMPYENHN